MVHETSMAQTLEKRSVQKEQRAEGLRAERERLDAIEADMRAGNYVTWDEWKRKNGYTSHDK